MADDQLSSKRFRPSRTRRDFLGLAAVWAAAVALAMATIGALRLPMPSVFPESSSKVKLGPPDRFAVGSSTYFPQHQLWLFRGEEGFYAISAVCTHLGCVVERDDEGQFICPCHGSAFDDVGRVKAGPAPKGLVWVEMGVTPEGELTADTLKEISTEGYFVG